MPEFGKRGASVSRPVRAATMPGSSRDLSSALDVVEKGRLPYWANLGATQLVFGILVIAAAYLFVFLPYSGDIWRDHRLAGSWQAAYDMRALDGKCTRYYFLLTTCSVKIKSLAEQDRAVTSVGYMMAFTGGGGERLVPVRSTIEPSVVTIAYSAETKLWNRTLAFMAVTLGLAAMVLTFASALLRGRYKGGPAYLELVEGLASLHARTAPAT